MNPQSAFDPAYPTEAARQYLRGFVLGAERGGLSAIPEDVLSYAIDVGIRNGIASQRAGLVFADVYFRLAKRREPRGGYGSATAYLIASFEAELQSNKIVL